MKKESDAWKWQHTLRFVQVTNATQICKLIHSEWLEVRSIVYVLRMTQRFFNYEHKFRAERKCSYNTHTNAGFFFISIYFVFAIQFEAIANEFE